ncbi:hypothetical protein [Sporisorium scitamineum]|uniref:Uncharacterized protein n=1 Tax=Sporisorium scitamineum TaxID=49012 RepID=A0A0F7RXN0_9BASI|nr:hypothetical protein [Sporisorium scitamineum]
MWARAKKDGFGFDSDNWNHLAASMARAGQLEEALSVVEHVLYHDPPNALMRSRLSSDKRIESSRNVEAEVDRLAEERSDVVDEELDDDSDFDSLPPTTLLDPATTHRSDATTVSSTPPNRRHQNRTDDDPYVDLTFDRPTPTHRADDLKPDTPTRQTSDNNEYTEPGAFYLNPEAKLPLHRDLTASRGADSFSPWYAHFVTMEAISRGLAELREASQAIRLLDRYRTAAGV